MATELDVLITMNEVFYSEALVRRIQGELLRVGAENVGVHQAGLFTLVTATIRHGGYLTDDIRRMFLALPWCEPGRATLQMLTDDDSVPYCLVRAALCYKS